MPMTRTNGTLHFTCLCSDRKQTLIVFHVKLTMSLKNFSSHLKDVKWTDQLWKAAENKSMTDVEFVFANEQSTLAGKEEESLFAHRFILYARSPVFAAMFTTDMIESQTGRVEIYDADFHLFYHFLKFIYTGKLDISARNLHLLALADKYQIETLREMCKAATREVNIQEIIVSTLSS